MQLIRFLPFIIIYTALCMGAEEESRALPSAKRHEAIKRSISFTCKDGSCTPDIDTHVLIESSKTLQHMSEYIEDDLHVDLPWARKRSVEQFIALISSYKVMDSFYNQDEFKEKVSENLLSIKKSRPLCSLIEIANFLDNDAFSVLTKRFCELKPSRQEFTYFHEHNLAEHLLEDYFKTLSSSSITAKHLDKITNFFPHIDDLFQQTIPPILQQNINKALCKASPSLQELKDVFSKQGSTRSLISYIRFYAAHNKSDPRTVANASFCSNGWVVVTSTRSGYATIYDPFTWERKLSIHVSPVANKFIFNHDCSLAMCIAHGGFFMILNTKTKDLLYTSMHDPLFQGLKHFIKNYFFQDNCFYFVHNRKLCRLDCLDLGKTIVDDQVDLMFSLSPKLFLIADGNEIRMKSVEDNEYLGRVTLSSPVVAIEPYNENRVIVITAEQKAYFFTPLQGKLFPIGHPDDAYSMACKDPKKNILCLANNKKAFIYDENYTKPSLTIIAQEGASITKIGIHNGIAFLFEKKGSNACWHCYDIRTGIKLETIPRTKAFNPALHKGSLLVCKECPGSCFDTLELKTPGVLIDGQSFNDLIEHYE